MEIQLTISDQVLIRNLGAYKTPEQLARIINKPVELIRSQCESVANQFTKMPKVSKSPKKVKIRSAGKKRISHVERKLIREKKKAEEAKLKREKQSVHAQEQERLRERRKKLEKSTLVTRQLDLTNAVRVQLNAKTTVWVKPGTDIDKLKQQFNIK